MENNKINHYYGDSVRTIFIITGVIMIATLPFFSKLIALPIGFAITGILILAILSGLLNPVKKWIIIIDAIVATVAFLSFEYSAVFAYMHLPPTETVNVLFFWTNQIFSLLLFLAVYLSTKTLRGMYIDEAEANKKIEVPSLIK